MAKLLGRSIIGFREGVEASEQFYGISPASGQPLEPGFSSAAPAEVELAAQLAFQAATICGRISGRERGAFLRKIAANIESLAEELVERAYLETALPKPRLQGETARTCGQLRRFAQVVEEGSWTGARIDRAQPDRKPAPRPAIRSMLRPLRPVAVVGAATSRLRFQSLEETQPPRWRPGIR
jgi:alpha-ketoglutaric semialdehyde dehydrogenase